MIAKSAVLHRPERPAPVDAADRARINTDHDTTFFVEAGAGTGKTTALVSRIVTMVANGRVELERLAAITFTEAAAAELRSRIRHDLEIAARDPRLSLVEQERCGLAASQVDLATIQTIHAFAGTLLRTFPIEAGLPPGFQVWDDVQSNLAFDERFRAWLWDELPSDAPDARGRREAIRRALLLGMTFDNLRQLANAFEEQGDLLDEETTWPAQAPPDPLVVAHQVGGEIRDLERHFHFAKLGDADPMIAEYRRHELAVGRLLMARNEIDALAALISLGQFNTTKGNQAAWNRDATGQIALRSIKDALKSANASVAETLEAHRRSALGAVLGYVRDFTLASSGARRDRGVATFHDLLTWARNLLRDNEDARQRARRRFTRIFVDEFQDTDPLQAEIVWFLAGCDATATVNDWSDVVLEPGKLFVVGDPKQSIYRFRRADIGLYSRIYGKAPTEDRAQLRENFRSVSAVVDWVNYQFRTDMVGASGIQAPYVDLHAPDTDPNLGGVHVVGGPVDGGAALAYEQEALAIAQLAHQAVAEEWQVRDTHNLNTWRSARYADVCVLLRARTNVRNLEDAFERLAVPYRMESGSLVLDTQEVRDLLACLRAIDDPSDQVALVAALRSPAYACSDVDLLDWIDTGGKLDYLHPQETCSGVVGEAFRSLRDFHLARIDRSVATTVETFIRDRMLAVGVFDGRRSRETWRRLRYVVAQARALASADRPTLRALVDWLESLQREKIRDVESPLPEADEDAVRVLTIHGAKGLEFPITIVTGLCATRPGPSSPVQVLSNRETGRLDVKVGAFQTEDYAASRSREDELERAERTRLFYVAATRARDHLVLSLFHGKRAGQSDAARYLEGLTGAGAPRWSRPSLDDLPSPASPHRGDPIGAVLTPEEQLKAEAAWSRERAAAIQSAAISPVVTASQLAHAAASGEGRDEWAVGDSQNATEPQLAELLDDDNRESSNLDLEARPRSPYDQSVRIGHAVHSALAEIGPRAETSAVAATERAARENQIESDRDVVRRLVEAALRSPTVVGARSLRHWREVSVGIEVGGVILAGRIDLVIENADGTLRIVDYKTELLDGWSVDDRAQRHRTQAGAYALAIQQSTGKRVEAVTLVFAASGGGEVTWVDVPDLVAEAGRQIGRHELLACTLVDSSPGLD